MGETSPRLHQRRLADHSNIDCLSGLSIFSSSSSTIIGNAADVACDKGERDNASAGNQAERDDPLVTNRVDEGANERDGDHDMSKR
jgi:hypothetical protein